MKVTQIIRNNKKHGGEILLCGFLNYSIIKMQFQRLIFSHSVGLNQALEMDRLSFAFTKLRIFQSLKTQNLTFHNKINVSRLALPVRRSNGVW